MNIQKIRENSELIKENQIKRFSDPNVIDKILTLDDNLRKIKCENDVFKFHKNQQRVAFKDAQENEIINAPFEEIFGDLQEKKIKFTDLTKQQLQSYGKFISDNISVLDEQYNKMLKERDDMINKLGNILHSDVPISNNEDNNTIIYESEIDKTKKKYNHIELCEKLGFVDMVNGIAVSGHRGYFLTGMGVRLNMALINYSMDFMEAKGYTLMSTPHTIVRDLMSKITQLSEYEETLYKLQDHDKFLIATSEQPLTAYFSEKILDKNTLPIKFAGISSCYRKETGRHGTQMRGIYRVHQFEKVEQFCVTEPEKSWDMFYEMMNTSREFYDSLGIKYRVINIVSGALNNAGAMKWDLEAWFSGLGNYGELVSCTNCLDYFSARIGTKVKQTKEYAHMLNCTLMANTRVICCLMEQYQTDTGMNVPQCLQKYMGCDFIPYKK